MSDVVQTWLDAGGDTSSFPTEIQAVLATQVASQVASVGIVRTEAYDRALLNAVNEALGG